MQNIVDNIINSNGITFEQAVDLLKGEETTALIAMADKVRRKFLGNKIDICSLVNAKSGKCDQDCKFCAQSGYYNTDCNIYPLIPEKQIIEAAKQAAVMKASHFCIVTSGGAVNDDDFTKICNAVKTIRSQTSLEVDCSLGLLSDGRAEALKKAGIARYNHNIETSPDYYADICTTHSYYERVKTIENIRKQGIESCCGGIVGMGETLAQRVRLAFELKRLKVSCVPVNILNPRPLTPLEKIEAISPIEVIRIIAVFRLILPTVTLKIAGGRESNLRDLQALSFLAGANGFIIGNYLTTVGRSPKEDLQMVKDLGMEV